LGTGARLWPENVQGKGRLTLPGYDPRERYREFRVRMAAGLPVVVSDVGGNWDVVEHGQSGLLLDLDDTTAWVRGIADLLEDPGLRERLGEAARRGAASFSIGEIAERYRRLYETLLPVDRG
jgi:glycosyltransferase involved in cell wall biosynthesis